MKAILIVLLLGTAGCSSVSRWERQVEREAMAVFKHPNLVKHPEQNRVRAYYWY